MGVRNQFICGGIGLLEMLPEERSPGRVFSSEPSYYVNCDMFSDLPQEENWEDDE